MTREPPHNFEAEQALLGSILVNNAAHERAAEMVRAEHFADPTHGRLYDMLGRLIARGQLANAFTLKTMAEADEGLKAAGGPAYLARLAAASVHVLDVGQAAATVRDCATRRGLIAAANEAASAAYDEAGELTAAEQIEAVERRLYELTDGRDGGGFARFEAALTGAMQAAEAAHSRTGELAGISTGLTELDRLTGGLHKSDLVILAGRPGMGKTALATNIAFAAARAHQTEPGADGRPRTADGAVVGFFSLEMSAEQLATRIVSEQVGVPSDRMRRGKLTGPEMDRAIEVSASLQSLPLYVDDTPALSIAGLRARARRLKRQHGLDLIVVDYLQLVDAAHRKDGRVNEVSEISRGLKTLAKELKVPVIALSQLNRAVEQRQDKRPQLSDLRDSGTIEQDADVVMFVYRAEYYLERGSDGDRARLAEVAGLAEIHIAKQRHGPTGVAQLRFDGPTTRFTDRSDADRERLAT